MTQTLPKRWEAMFHKLVQYKNMYGHTNVSRFDDDNRALSQWVSQQRQRYSRKMRSDDTEGLLSDNQQAMLESIGFCWHYGQERRSSRMQWDQVYEKVQKFYNLHGCLPGEAEDSAHEEEIDEELQGWVTEQRKQFILMDQGKASDLTEVQYRRLRPLFICEQSSDDEEDDEITEASVPLIETKPEIKSKNIEGPTSMQIEPKQPQSCDVSQYDDADEESSNIIDPSLKPEGVWGQRLQELIEFKKKYNHCDPDLKKEEYPELANWCDEQRKRYKSTSSDVDYFPLKAHELAKLVAAGFDWKRKTAKSRPAPKFQYYRPKPRTPTKSIRARWEERYQELLQFRQKYGHCNVSLHDPKHKALARWVNEQRGKYNRCKGNIDNKKKRSSRHKPDETYCPMKESKLNSIGFCWKIGSGNRTLRLKKIDSWETGFKQLQEYHRMHGHSSVPYHYGELKTLGVWVQEQQKQYLAKKSGEFSLLSLIQVELLESVGFDSQTGLKKPATVVPNSTRNKRKRSSTAKSSTDKPFNESDSEWNSKYRKLQKFVTATGHCDVSVQHKLSDSNLMEWVNKQRYYYELNCRGCKTCLDGLRQAKLDLLGFIWKPLDDNSGVAAADLYLANSQGLTRRVDVDVDTILHSVLLQSLSREAKKTKRFDSIPATLSPDSTPTKRRKVLRVSGVPKNITVPATSASVEGNSSSSSQRDSIKSDIKDQLISDYSTVMSESEDRVSTVAKWLTGIIGHGPVPEEMRLYARIFCSLGLDSVDYITHELKAEDLAMKEFEPIKKFHKLKIIRALQQQN